MMTGRLPQRAAISSMIYACSLDSGVKFLMIGMMGPETGTGPQGERRQGRVKFLMTGMMGPAAEHFRGMKRVALR